MILALLLLPHGQLWATVEETSLTADANFYVVFCFQLQLEGFWEPRGKVEFLTSQMPIGV